MAAHGSTDHGTTGKTLSDSEHNLPLPTPEIIVLGPPGIFRKYDKQFCERFRILKSWESPIPLEQFISKHARDAQAMICSAGVKHVGAEILSLLPSLGLVIATSSGVNHIDLGECRRRGVSVASASTVFSADVADLAVGLLIDVLRRISAGNRFAKAEHWPVNSVQGPFSHANKFMAITTMEQPEKHRPIQNIISFSTPEIIVVGPPSVFRKYEKEFCERFRILKPWESPIPLEQFMSKHARNAEALFTSGVVKRVGADILGLLPSLRLIVTAIDLGECRRLGLAGHRPHRGLHGVADLAVGLLIDVLRKISAGNRFVKAGLCAANSDQAPFPLILIKHPSLLLSTSAGLDHIDLNECGHPTMFSADVADLVVGLLIDILGRISADNHIVKTGLWPVRGPCPLPGTTKFSCKRVGIVGLGNIGQEVAKRLEGFDCKISYYSRNQKSSISYPFYSDVSELAAHSDILVICCALTDETYHLITKEVLVALGKQGVIVNIARGAIIDEKELVHFLQDGKIAGAGLDVFEDEPNVPRELFEMDNVVLSPHVAVFTEESFRDLYDLVVGNLEAFFSNKPLLSPVILEG